MGWPERGTQWAQFPIQKPIDSFTNTGLYVSLFVKGKDIRQALWMALLPEGNLKLKTLYMGSSRF